MCNYVRNLVKFNYSNSKDKLLYLMLNKPYRIMIYSCHRLRIIVIDTLYSYDRLNQFDDINVLQKH